MTNKLIVGVEDSSNLSDDELIQQFVKTTRTTDKVEGKLEEVSRTLGTSQSLEDLAFVLSSVDQLTPEQTAMVQINANLAVAGTDKDVNMVSPEEITTESFKESANDLISNATDAFSDVWYSLLSNLESVAVINQSTAIKVEQAIAFIKSHTNSDTLPMSESIDLNDYPQFLWMRGEVTPNLETGQDAIVKLETIRAALKNRLSTASVNIAETILSIIKKGMSSFGKETASLSQEHLKEYSTKLSKMVRRTIATEDVSTSADGLIIDVELTDGFEFDESDYLGEDGLKLVRTDKSTPPAMESIAMISRTSGDFISQLEEDLFVLKASNEAASVLLNNSLALAVNRFASTVKLLLSEEPVHTSTKESVLGYCELFIRAANTANTEIAFMLYAARFLIAHSELLVTVASKTKPNPEGIAV